MRTGKKFLTGGAKTLCLCGVGRFRRPPERPGEYEDACMKSESVSQADLTGFKKIRPSGARLLSCEGREPFMAYGAFASGESTPTLNCSGSDKASSLRRPLASDGSVGGEARVPGKGGRERVCGPRC